MNHMTKRIAALLMAVLLLLSSVPAAAAEAGPRLSVGSASLYAGNSVSVTVRADDLESVATMDFTLLYDAAHFTLNSAVATGIFPYADINTATPGEVRFLGLAADGYTGGGTLMTLRFTAASDTEPGDYPLSLSVGEVYTADWQPCEIGKNNGTLTVLERSSDIPSISFSCGPSVYQAAKDDLVTFTFYCYSPKSLAGGVFQVTYDPSLLAYDNITLLNGMQQGNTLYDVNDRQNGRVVMSYATDAAVVAGSLFSVQFRVVTEENTGATITMTPDQLYADSGQALRANPCSASVVIQQHEIVPDYPDLIISAPSEAYANETFTVIVSLEEGSGVAAADFTVSYDTTQLIVTEEPESLTGQGQTLMYNPSYSNGSVKFSFIATDGIESSQDLIAIRFRAVANEEYTAAITASGRGVVDKDYHQVIMDYPGASIRIKPLYDITWSGIVGEDETEEVGAGIVPAHSIPVRPGYTFVGWKDENGSVTPVGTDLPAVTTNMTYTAQWEATVYNMTFAEGTYFGEGVDPDAYTIESGITATPVRGGYVFVGWIAEPIDEGDTDYNWDSVTAPIANSDTVGLYGNVKLTPVWELNAYTVFADYAYAGNGNKLLLIGIGGIDSSNTVIYDGNAMFYTEDQYYLELLNAAGGAHTSYNSQETYTKAYLYIVSDATTADAVSDLVSVTSSESVGENVRIIRNMDVNLNDRINAGDYGIVDDLLAGRPSNATIQMRLEADTHTSAYGQQRFGSIDDIAAIIEAANIF